MKTLKHFPVSGIYLSRNSANLPATGSQAFLPQLPIAAPLLHQLVMRAFLNQPAVINNQDLVGLFLQLKAPMRLPTA
jgi:hypothetical protein